MDMEQFAAEMERRGCTRIPDTQVFCGTYEDFPFSAHFQKGTAGGSTQFAIIFLFAKNMMSARPFKRIRDAVKGKAKTRVLPINHGSLAPFSLTVPNPDDFAFVFDTFVAGMVDVAKEKGYTPPPVCPYCHKPGCDAYAFVDYFRPVHAACVQQKSGEALAAVEENEVSGNYATGLIGAVLGAIVGTIPNVLLIFFAQRIFAVLCALIPLAAYYGYKWFRGRMSKAVMPIVIVISVLMTPVIDFLTELAFMLAEGYYITPLDYIQAFVMYPGEFAGALLQILLFIGLGILVVSGLIKRNNTHVSTQAVSTLASLRPMAGAAVAQPAVPPMAPAQPVAQPMAQPVAPAAPVAPQPAAVVAPPPMAQPVAPPQPYAPPAAQPPAAPPVPPTPPTEG